MRKILDRLKAIAAERFFLALALPFGLALLVVTPPFQVPDETVHFCRACHVSEWGLRADRQENLIGCELPSSLSRLMSAFTGIQFYYDKKQDVNTFLEQFRLTLDSRERDFVDFRASAFYSPLPYVPQACGIAVARMSGLGPLLLFYAGRMANLMAYLGLIWVAIRRTPVHGWVMALVALMPMAMFQAASVSADGLTNALAFLFIAEVFLLTIASDKGGNFSPWRVVPLAGMIGLCKGYLPLLALVFLVPRRRFPGKARHALWVTSVFAAGAGLLAIWAWVTHDLFGAVESGLSPGTQFSLLLNEPWNAAGAILTTWANHDFIRFIEQSFVGRLGYLDTPLPAGLVHLYIAVLFATAFLDAPAESIRFTFRQRLICVLIGILTVLLVSTWLYVTYTPPGQVCSIRGIQGRYFIPVAPLVFVVLLNRAGTKMFSCLKPWLLGFVTVAMLITIHALIKRYYVV